MKRQTENPDIYFNSIEYFQKLEKSIAANLGLTDLSSGIQVIRDKNGWRENEKFIAFVLYHQLFRKNRAFQDG